MLTQQKFPRLQRLCFITIILAQQSLLSIQMVQMKRSTCSVFHCSKHHISQSHVSPSSASGQDDLLGPRPKVSSLQTGCLNVTDKLAGVGWTSFRLWTLMNSERCSLSTSLNMVCRTAAALLNTIQTIKMHHPTSIYRAFSFFWLRLVGLNCNFLICLYNKYLFKFTRKRFFSYYPKSSDLSHCRKLNNKNQQEVTATQDSKVSIIQ